jgi:acetyl esterase
MPYVHPQVARFLADMSAPSGPPPVTLEEQRAAFSRLWRALSPPSARVHDRRVVNCPGPRGDIEMLVYRPRPSDVPLPALVFYHGGGCVTLSPEDFEATSTRLAVEAECIVVVPRYRQAPEHPFPASLEDAFAAYRWVVENAASLAADRARVAVGGDSAGGYLAAALCIEAREAGVPQPVGQLLIYPMTDMAAATPSRKSLDYWVNDEQLAGVTAVHVGDRVLDPRASPLRAGDHRGLAPAYVLTAGLDPLRDEGRAYVEALRRAGGEAVHFDYEGMVHGFFSFGAVIEQGNLAVQHAAGILRHLFSRQP